MRIPLRHHRRFMPENPLDFVQVHTGLHHACRTGMAQIMEPEILTCAALSANRKLRRRLGASKGVPAALVNTNSESSGGHCSYL
jgi:hypothetical protein